MTIKDIFGNKIEVTDLNAAIEETKKFLGWSKCDTMIFTEYKLVNSQDHFGKPTRIPITPKSPKEVTNLEFYQHQLNQLTN